MSTACVLPGFVRVTRSRKCLICGKPDWCLVSVDGDRAICQRIESARRWSDAGWLHIVRESVLRPLEPFRAVRDKVALDLTPLAQAYARSTDGGMDRHAACLCLKTSAIRALGGGYADNIDALTFPMRDWFGSIIGIRFRSSDGAKWSARGSTNGLFYDPALLGEGPLVFCEGPTDAAALLGLRFTAVGRPSCSTGDAHASGLVQRARRGAVVIADWDEVGRRGADKLGTLIGAPVVTPPAKDIRSWIMEGATRNDVLILLQSVLR